MRKTFISIDIWSVKGTCVICGSFDTNFWLPANDYKQSVTTRWIDGLTDRHQTQWSVLVEFLNVEDITRGPKGHISCTWVQFAPFLKNRPGRPLLFTDRPEKHKLGRGRWELASCKVSLNSIQRFQRKSKKCLSQSEARAAILFFWSARKTQTW